MKYSKWIGLVIYILLIVVCFLPWTYHADLDKYFNGFLEKEREEREKLNKRSLG